MASSAAGTSDELATGSDRGTDMQHRPAVTAESAGGSGGGSVGTAASFDGVAVESALPLLRFQPVASFVDVSFWRTVADWKLKKMQLDETPVPIQGFLSPSAHHGILPRLELRDDSFPDSDGVYHVRRHKYQVQVPGKLFVFNTVEGFQALDKQRLINDTFTASQASRTPLSFVIISFPNLKSHHYLYWVAFPVPLHATPITGQVLPQPLPEATAAATAQLQVDEVLAASEPSHPFFLWMRGDVPRALPLSQWSSLSSEQQLACDFGCLDVGNLADAPSWVARCLLWYVSTAFGVQVARLVLYRPQFRSFIAFNVRVPSLAHPPVATGWEPNAQGAARPRMVQLQQHLDDRALAEQSVHLNLELMKWRALPALDTSRLSQLKCLLLGAGTLGCYVSRSLMAWGIKHITFVDNGKVSFSNPVRQPLYEFEDCRSGGKPKAAAAAAALSKIYPGVTAAGVDLSIPMPGHAASSPAAVHEAESAATQLAELVQAHDVVFLLTDTRESRWLPTVLGSLYNKVVINVALGFDSWVVMRHGVRQVESESKLEQSWPHLGCYFCSDVVAPGDSTKDRTLDQQCTVTRPGAAPQAAAQAVELLVALVHHDHGAAAPAMAQGVAGCVPHQIRGCVSLFHTQLLQSEAFVQCTACSNCIISAAHANLPSLLLNTMNEPGYLEKLTGLADLLAGVSEAAVWEADADDEDDF